MSLKSIINSALAATLIASAAPAKAEHYNFETTDIISYSEPDEPKVNLPKLTVNYKGYKLTEQENSDLTYYLSTGMLQQDDLKAYLGFVALKRYDILIDFVTGYYQIDENIFMKIINQESSFRIGVVGPMREHGLGQQRDATAKDLVKRITEPGSDIYYPYLKTSDYSFRKLSKDYRLNIILTAAKIKSVNTDFESVLEQRNMSKQDLADFLKNYGKTTTLKQMRKGNSKKFSFYSANSKTRQRINRFWGENSAEEQDLMYLVYNGGPNAIDNLARNNLISEILTYNFTSLCERNNLFYNFLSMHSRESINYEADSSDLKAIKEDTLSK